MAEILAASRPFCLPRSVLRVEAEWRSSGPSSPGHTKVTAERGRPKWDLAPQTSCSFPVSLEGPASPQPPARFRSPQRDLTAPNLLLVSGLPRGTWQPPQPPCSWPHWLYTWACPGLSRLSRLSLEAQKKLGENAISYSWETWDPLSLARSRPQNHPPPPGPPVLQLLRLVAATTSHFNEKAARMASSPQRMAAVMTCFGRDNASWILSIEL